MKTNRWPPIFALAVTALLVFAVLPNPLRVPQNNPAAQAEFAPVPGESQDPNNANFGETGQATSGGIGAGGLIDPGAGIPPPPPPPVYSPRNKPCTGTPPRQTEDPLSPPCVPFFDADADNGGSNGQQGLTADEIKIVFYNDLGVEGDLNEPYSPDQESAGHESSQNNEQTYLVRTIKGLLQFYTNRYQTYNRRPHLIAVASSGGIATPCSARKTEAAVINRDYKPFAVVHFGDGGQCFLNEMAKLGVPGFGLNSDVPRAEFKSYPYTGTGQGDAPGTKDIGMVWGFYPDQETMASYSAGFICRKLADRPAKFSIDQVLLAQPKRKFALLFPTKSDRGPESAQMANLLVNELASQCDMRTDPSGDGELIVKGFTGDGKTAAPTYMADLKRKNVTTIICYCVPVQTEVTVTTYQSAAESLNYYPEWYWDHASRMFRAVWNRQFGNKQMRSFGTSYHWPNPRFSSQHWYKAYRTVVPGTEPNKRFGFDLYHLFLNLFQGLQGAGPYLSPETVQKGMFTFKYLGYNPLAKETEADYYDHGDFERPVGGYGSTHWTAPYGHTYTFIDTGFAWWWDDSGRPPGSNEQGCLRAVRNGRRYHAGNWPEGDDDLVLSDSSSPCFEDDTSISKTSQFF